MAGVGCGRPPRRTSARKGCDASDGVPSAQAVMETNMADEPGTRPCVACRTPIEIGAAICPTCKSWQKNWKNSVTFYGSYVTAASIMVSAVFFAWNNLTQVFKPANKIEV